MSHVPTSPNNNKKDPALDVLDNRVDDRRVHEHKEPRTEPALLVLFAFRAARRSVAFIYNILTFYRGYGLVRATSFYRAASSAEASPQ